MPGKPLPMQAMSLSAENSPDDDVSYSHCFGTSIFVVHDSKKIMGEPSPTAAFSSAHTPTTERQRFYLREGIPFVTQPLLPK